jgi:hypothetical protein
LDEWVGLAQPLLGAATAPVMAKVVLGGIVDVDFDLGNEAAHARTCRETITMPVPGPSRQ